MEVVYVVAGIAGTISLVVVVLTLFSGCSTVWTGKRDLAWEPAMHG